MKLEEGTVYLASNTSFLSALACLCSFFFSLLTTLGCRRYESRPLCMETHFLTPVEFALVAVSPSLLGFILTPLGVFKTSPARIFIDAGAHFSLGAGQEWAGLGRADRAAVGGEVRMSAWVACRRKARRHVRTRLGPIRYHSPGCRPGPADPCHLSAGRISEARFGFSARSLVSRRGGRVSLSLCKWCRFHGRK